MSTMSEKRSHQFFCDAELVFECEEGFRMVGVNKLRCMESGNWSNSMPICEYIPPSMNMCIYVCVNLFNLNFLILGKGISRIL